MRALGLTIGLLLAASAAQAEQHTYINPLDVDYRYNWEQKNDGVSYRTAADPVIVRHKDAYYLFLTLADGYWRSTDLIHWTFITPSMWPFSGVVAPAVDLRRRPADHLAFHVLHPARPDPGDHGARDREARLPGAADAGPARRRR